MKYLLFLLFVLLSGSSVFSQTSREDGIDLYRAGEFEKAVEVLKAITATDKKDQIAWVYLGAALFRSGNSKDAGKAFQKGKAKVDDLVPGDDSQVTAVKRPRPRYTDMARRSFTTGLVKLAVELATDGKIGFIYTIQSLPDGLTEESITAAKRITFTPAVKKGKPVRTVAILEYNFDIY